MRDLIEKTPAVHSPISEQRFDFPDMSGIGVGESVINQFDLSAEQKNAAMVAKDKLSSSKNLYFISNAYGLGDFIIEYVHILAIAKKKPDTKLTVLIPKIVSSMQGIDTNNGQISLIESLAYQDIKTITQSDGVFTSLSPEISGRFALQRTESFNNADIDWLIKNQKIISPSEIVSWGKIEEWAKENGILKDSTNFFDALYATYEHSLFSVPTTKKDYENGIFEFDLSDIEKYPQRYDFVIAPDAREGTNRELGQSIKSLTPGSLELFFSKMNPTATIAIVVGVEHPQYCEQIGKIAQKYCENVEIIRPANLDEFSHVVLMGKTYIGMDSGTTHIAASISDSVNGLRTIDVVSMFNTNYTVLQQYAIRGQRSKVIPFPGAPDPNSLSMDYDEGIDLGDVVATLEKKKEEKAEGKGLRRFFSFGARK